MKYIIKYVLIFLTGIFMFSSCSEDVLDVPALGKYVGDPDPNRPLDLNMINAEAIGLYKYINIIYNGGNGGWGFSTYVTLNCASDDGVAGGASAGDRPEYEAADMFTLDGNNQGTKAIFDKFYTGVAKCNKFLADFPDVGSDSLLRNRAEVKFLRAYYYFYLVNFYGAIPLATKPTDPGNLPNAPIADIYAQMEKDLTEAIASNLLPANKAALSADDKIFTRVTVLTAQALLGKIYVFHSTVLGENRWAEAKQHLDIVKNSGDYSLAPNFANLWTSAYEMKDGNPENIFEANFHDGYALDWGSVPNGNLDMQLMGVRALAGYPGLEGGWGFCKPTQKLVEAFISENDSIRLDETVLAAQWPDAILQWETDKKLRRSLKTAGASFAEPYNGTGYWNGKYRQDEVPANQYMYNQNEIIMRYAETLLLLAETEYKLGNEPVALGYVNQVRARVSLAPKSSSGSQLWDDIVKEKQLELAFESIRYWDLIRWGIAAQEIPGFKTTTKGLWPFPFDQIAVDPNLKQNEGY